MNTNTKKKYPDSIRYIPMIVDALRAVGGFTKASSVKDWIADSMTSSNQPVPDKVLASGATKFANDIQWARMYLVNAGFLEPMETAGYGNWKLTRKGWDERVDDRGAITIYEATANKGKAQKSSAEDAPSESAQGELPGTSSWAHELKKILTEMPDKGFERLCARIMTENGLLATKTTGQTGDGGVDGEGFLAFDTLGLIKTRVAWQCKRFKDIKVPPSEIRDFRGAIEGRAQYGLFFTTSTFTPSAEVEARRAGATAIELVGLLKLIDLMKEHEIGVKKAVCDAARSTYEVNSVFFDEYLHPAGTKSNAHQLL